MHPNNKIPSTVLSYGLW